jgi:hypothetical protein
VRPAISARLGAGFGIVAVGILVAVATNMALTVFSSAKLAFALGGLALLIPTMVVQHPQAYWLFLLVMSLPFDITKNLSLSMVDSDALGKTYGVPISGTTGLEIYLSDVILIAMLLPWLGRYVFDEHYYIFLKSGTSLSFILPGLCSSRWSMPRHSTCRCLSCSGRFYGLCFLCI